jgi:hypothetical protein
MKNTIPARAETLEVLQLMGDFEPILMLPGDADGFGTRWIIHGQQVQPAIARYLMEEGCIVDSGETELGMRRLTLTPTGIRFRDDGARWWRSQTWWQRLKITVFG